MKLTKIFIFFFSFDFVFIFSCTGFLQYVHDIPQRLNPEILGILKLSTEEPSMSGEDSLPFHKEIDYDRNLIFEIRGTYKICL